MNNISLIALSFLLCCTSNGFGQIAQTIEKLGHIQKTNIEAIEDLSYPSRSTRTHHFYLDKSWQNSYVITLSDEVIYFNGRYNVLNKAIECFSNNQQRILYPKKVKGAVVGKNAFIPLSQELVRQMGNNRYAEILSSGQIHLLNSYIMDTRMDSGSSISFEGTGKKTYFIDEVLYYTQDFKSITKLSKSKNNVLDLFGTKRETIADFVKENRLRFNNKEDLIRIFDFYNALVD